MEKAVTSQVLSPGEGSSAGGDRAAVTTRRDPGGRRRRRAHPLVNDVSGCRSPSLIKRIEFRQMFITAAQRQNRIMLRVVLVCLPFRKPRDKTYTLP